MAETGPQELRKFINYLDRNLPLTKTTKVALFDTLGIKTWLAWFLRIFWGEKLPTNRKDTISALCTMFNKLISEGKIDELKSLKMIHLKKNENSEHYLNLAHEDFGEIPLPIDKERVIVAYRLYDKYKEYLEKEAANKTSWWHTLKYNTTIQNLRHKRTYLGKHFGTGVYFLDTDEQFVLLEGNKTEDDKKLSIKKYIWPMWIRVKQAAESTVKDIEQINQYNSSLPPISVKPGDYIVEVDIGPHEYAGGKLLQEAYKKLQLYLSTHVYDEIIANDKRLWKDTKKEDIHIPFLYWITPLTQLSAIKNWELRNMPLETAKRTSTYMYSFRNPQAKYTEPTTLYRVTRPSEYKALKKIADKYDARDIAFASISLQDFLAWNDSQAK